MNIHDQDIYFKAKNEGIAQGISQGFQQGEYQAKVETAKNLLTMNISIENIAKATGLPIDTVKTISNNEIS